MEVRHTSNKPERKAVPVILSDGKTIFFGDYDRHNASYLKDGIVREASTSLNDLVHSAEELKRTVVYEGDTITITF